MSRRWFWNCKFSAGRLAACSLSWNARLDERTNGRTLQRSKRYSNENVITLVQSEWFKLLQASYQPRCRANDVRNSFSFFMAVYSINRLFISVQKLYAWLENHHQKLFVNSDILKWIEWSCIESSNVITILAAFYDSNCQNYAIIRTKEPRLSWSKEHFGADLLDFSTRVESSTSNKTRENQAFLKNNVLVQIWLPDSLELLCVKKKLADLMARIAVKGARRSLNWSCFEVAYKTSVFWSIAINFIF